MAESGLKGLLCGAERAVREYLARYGGTLSSTRILLDPDLGEETLATHRYPDTVVVRETSVPESVIAHELVHIAQGTLEHFRGFRLLYTLLAEGLADWVAKALYPEHKVKYEAGYRLIELLVEVDEGAISDLLRLNYLPLVPEDVDIILGSPRLPVYSRGLLSRMAGRIREGLRAAIEGGITDPTFVTLGEELRAWKFLLDGRFEGVREEVDEVVGEWFGLEEG
ncbi:MAG: hypothetical protein ACPLYD_02550 [Anaerolineae bacterium]